MVPIGAVALVHTEDEPTDTCVSLMATLVALFALLGRPVLVALVPPAWPVSPAEPQAES